MKGAKDLTPATRMKKARTTELKTTKRTSKHSEHTEQLRTWAVQCKECHKWRVIPTQEEYEEIRRKLTEDSFTCNKLQNVSCSDSTDLEYGSKCVWVIDKPNLPKTPAGFKRGLVLRKSFNKMDCYFVAPNGKKLRSPSEVGSFLHEHAEYQDLSPADFSFKAPKIMKDTIHKYLLAKELGVSTAVIENSNAG